MRAIIFLLLTVFTFPFSTILSQVDSVKINEHEKAKTIVKFDPSRNPFDDLKQAVKKAKRTKKKILLDVGGEWCIWCHKLDDFFEANKDVTDFLNQHYIVLKINYSKENKNEKFLSQYPKIPGYPHFFVIDSKGKFLHSQDTGVLEKDGAHDRDKVLSFLKEWATK